MPRGDKSSYTDKQKSMAGHIEEGYESRGLSVREWPWQRMIAQNHFEF
jgi:hypothetical protein